MILKKGCRWIELMIIEWKRFLRVTFNVSVKGGDRVAQYSIIVNAFTKKKNKWLYPTKHENTRKLNLYTLGQRNRFGFQSVTIELWLLKMYGNFRWCSYSKISNEVCLYCVWARILLEWYSQSSNLFVPLTKFYFKFQMYASNGKSYQQSIAHGEHSIFAESNSIFGRVSALTFDMNKFVWSVTKTNPQYNAL